jgi:phenylpropionate dioxygenase-like ring-hydroxylating dioxygenase large terminal subunit
VSDPGTLCIDMNDPQSSPTALLERRRQVERAIQKRMLEHIAAGLTTDFAAAPLSIPVSVYSDPVRLEAERRELFLKLPLMAGLSRDLENPGDIMVFEGAGPSIIIMRNGAGKVVAFRNMCMHRGSKLVETSCNVRRIVCPFHAWSYNHDGQLTGQPGAAAFEGVDRRALHLLRVPSAERYGMIFVKVEVGDEEIDIDAFLGSMAPQIELLDLGAMSAVKRGTLSAGANWKHLLDTYGEGYHFARLHPDTLGTTHHTNLMAYDAFGPHWRVAYLAKSMDAMAQVPVSDWPPLDPAVYYIFPNTAIVVGSPQPGLQVVEVFNIFPTDVRSTHVNLALYAPTALATQENRPMLEAGYDLAARIVEMEDYHISAGACENLRWAPAGCNIVFGRNEIALQDMERNIAEAVGMPIE